MEMSVQGKTAASDFSIERILSEEPRSPRPADAPSWLCCTRYRPPRLPRYGAGTTSRARRVGRHARVPFTMAQAHALEAAYARAPYLAPPALRALAAALQLRDDRIKIWFQNRRARERREKCSIIAPPHGIALPATCMPPLRATRIGTTDGYSQEDPILIDNTTGYSKDPILSNHRDADRSYSREARNGPLYVYNSDSCLEENPSEAGRPETPLDIESVED